MDVKDVRNNTYITSKNSYIQRPIAKWTSNIWYSTSILKWMWKINIFYVTSVYVPFFFGRQKPKIMDVKSVFCSSGITWNAIWMASHHRHIRQHSNSSWLWTNNRFLINIIRDRASHYITSCKGVLLKTITIHLDK